MPLVRISLINGKSQNFKQKTGDIIYRAMVDSINVPVKDNFQIITEHDSNSLVFDPTYLDIQRSPDIIVIQITLNEGRTKEQKQTLYRAIADQLHTELNVRREDVFINLVEVKKENWSFGNGSMQYG